MISEQGSRDALWRRWEDNIEQIRPLRGEMLGVSDVGEVQRLAGRFLAGRAPLFDARVRGGRVLDGHGDLLAEDIFCLPDGPRILDCLEFDDRLRWVDGLDDAAFLAMDLERLGAGELADRSTGWYLEYSGDCAPVSLRHHYTAYRAFVRAKVSCLRCSQGDPAAGGEARQLAALALRHLHAGAVTLVLIGGLPGTGKSALAGVLAGLAPGRGIGVGTALVMEIMLTFGLVTVILGTASGARNVGHNAAIAVGGYVALAGLWASLVSGASMNPARSLGPALVSGNLHSIWIYLAGPLAGGLLAVALAWALRGPPSPAADQAAQGSADGHGPDAGHEANLGAGPDLTLWGTGREAGPLPCSAR